MKQLAFYEQQRQFLAYLRQPAIDLLPDGFDPDRMSVYAKLLYNNFDENLSACFPVLHSLLSDRQWQSILLDFIHTHRCLTPYYRQLPNEFMQYLQTERQKSPDDPAFLLELAHFEWVELELLVAETESVAFKPLREIDLLDQLPVFAPTIVLLHYQWPVQQINADYRPVEPGRATHILGFRDLAEQVRFIALSPATAQLLQGLQNQLTARQVLARMWPDEPPGLTQFATDLLMDLHGQGAIMGMAN